MHLNLDTVFNNKIISWIAIAIRNVALGAIDPVILSLQTADIELAFTA